MESWANVVLIAWLGFALVFGPLPGTPSTKTPKPKATSPTTPESPPVAPSDLCLETEVFWAEEEIDIDATFFEVESFVTVTNSAQTKPNSSKPLSQDDEDLFIPFALEENLDNDETKFERISNFDTHFTTGLGELLIFASILPLPVKETPSLSLNGSILSTLLRLRI